MREKLWNTSIRLWHKYGSSDGKQGYRYWSGCVNTYLVYIPARLTYAVHTYGWGQESHAVGKQDIIIPINSPI